MSTNLALEYIFASSLELTFTIPRSVANIQAVRSVPLEFCYHKVCVCVGGGGGGGGGRVQSTVELRFQEVFKQYSQCR